MVLSNIGEKYSLFKINISKYNTNGKASNNLNTKVDEEVIILSSLLSFFLSKNSLSIDENTLTIFPPVLLSKVKCDTNSGWVDNSVLFVNTVGVNNLVVFTHVIGCNFNTVVFAVLDIDCPS